MSLKAASIVLLLVYLSIWLKPLYPYIDFELNREYIVKTLCIERDKEVNACQGQCHLNREIEKNTSQEEEKQKRELVRSHENDSFFLLLFSFEPPGSNPVQGHHCLYLSNYRFLMHTSHFHPPEFV